MSSNFSRFSELGRKIVGVGRNYREHAAELGNPVPKEPLLFMKPASSYISEGSPIKVVLLGGNGLIQSANDALLRPYVKPNLLNIKIFMIPRGYDSLHHEIELGVVIGKGGADIKESQAMDHIAGYVLALDMTNRAYQNIAKKQGLPWELAKGFDTSCPVSAFIPKSSIPNPHQLNIWCKVNGELKQTGNTEDMIFSIPYLLSYISQYFTLEPYDLILTGTPAGVGPVKSGDSIQGGLSDIVKISFNVQTK